jgi:hypothetical protein
MTEDGGRYALLQSADSFQKKTNRKRIEQASAFIVLPFIGKFLEDEVQTFEKGVALSTSQHVVNAQQASEAQHGFADDSQELGGLHEGRALAGLDLFRESTDEDTQQGDLIPEDDLFPNLEAPAFCKGEVFGVEAVFIGVGIAGLAAAISFSRLFGWDNSVWACGHVQKSFRWVCALKPNKCSDPMKG